MATKPKSFPYACAKLNKLTVDLEGKLIRMKSADKKLELLNQIKELAEGLLYTEHAMRGYKTGLQHSKAAEK